MLGFILSLIYSHSYYKSLVKINKMKNDLLFIVIGPVLQMMWLCFWIESNIYSLFTIAMIPHSYHLVCSQPFTSIGSDFLWSFRKMLYKIRGKIWRNYFGHFHMLCISSQLNYPLCFQWASWFPKRCGSWGRAADWLFQPLSFKMTLCVCVCFG